MQELTIEVRKTARYAQMGDAGPEIRTVWFVVHGYAQLARYFIKEFEALNNDKTLVVAPEALSRFYAKGFFGGVGATWMTKEDRENEITDYTYYLQHLYEHITSQLNPDVEVNVLGFSQGCATVTRWVSIKKPRLSRLVLFAGEPAHDVNPNDLQEVLKDADFHYLYGNEDPFMDESIKKKVEKRLADYGIMPEMHEFNGKHEINIEALQKILMKG